MILNKSYVSRAGAYGIARKGDHLLVVRQKEGRFKGRLDLPGGGIESGETSQLALEREFQEEVGMEFKKCQFFDHFSSVVEAENEDGSPYLFIQLGVIYEVDDLSAIPDCVSELEFFWRRLSDLSSDHISPFLSQYLQMQLIPHN
ncbi:MAG: hypothetical protein S4CHLAM102_14040 [Chlamydiia bacterium]|nr:hypothetical protein [Chlamydiia bacterium]